MFLVGGGRGGEKERERLGATGFGCKVLRIEGDIRGQIAKRMRERLGE